jgi:hypothetical protein
MCPTLFSTFSDWLKANESVAVWLEGIALVLIFGLELREYRRQGVERKEQAIELAKQMAIAKDAADAAKFSAQAVLNSERAWIEIKLGAPIQSDYQDDAQSISVGLFECSIQIENHGRTIARVESIRIGADTVNEPLPQEPSSFTLRNLHSVLGSGQKEIVGGFHADAFVDWKTILDGTKRGVLRITVKYRDVVETSTLHETTAVYVFQNSLEEPPERVSFLSVYT